MSRRAPRRRAERRRPRYQIFVSSTFRDLVDERRRVLEALIQLEHIPVGMELFPEAGQRDWPMIARIIKSSDYFVLIIGGRYGSRDATGLGYTEKEYRCARAAGKPILALLHCSPDELPDHKTENGDGALKQLQRFRAEVEQAEECTYWRDARGLARTFTRVLAKAARRRPALGWVRPHARRAG